MKKIFSSIAMVSLMVAPQMFATSALAQSGPIGSFSGTADVYKGIALNCTVSANFSGSTVTLNIGSPEPMCALLSVTSNPHTYTYSGGVVTISGIQVTTITGGNCSGSLYGNYTPGSPNTITIPLQTIPATVAGTGDCTISGAVTQ